MRSQQTNTGLETQNDSELLDLQGTRNHRQSCFTVVCSQIFFRLLELLAFLLYSSDYSVLADLFSFFLLKIVQRSYYCDYFLVQ